MIVIKLLGRFVYGHFQFIFIFVRLFSCYILGTRVDLDLTSR